MKNKYNFRNDFKNACLILAIGFGLGALIISGIEVREQELIIWASRSAFAACGFFFGVFITIKRN